MTRKVIEDTTADVSHPSTPNNLQQQDSVIRNPAIPPAPVANLPEGDQEGHTHVAAPAHPIPICDNGANPFLTATDSRNTCLRNSSTTPSTERQFYAVSPSTPSQSPHTLHAGRHSTTHRRRRRQSLKNGPAGRKRRHAARDVWTFFEDNNSTRSCLFCK